VRNKALATIAAAWLGGVMSLAPVLPAQAETVTCSVTSTDPFTCNPASATVGVGLEFNIGAPIGGKFTTFLIADFDAGSLTVGPRPGGSAGFGSMVILSFTNLTSAFTSYSLISNGGVAGFDAGDIRAGSARVESAGVPKRGLI
jgi:hypothetical protein